LHCGAAALAGYLQERSASTILQGPSGLSNLRTGMIVGNGQQLIMASPEDISRLRSLTHDLSNSMETILQASYLLGQAELTGNSRKWVQLIESAARDAVQINRQIREILRAQP